MRVVIPFLAGLVCLVGLYLFFTRDADPPDITTVTADLETPKMQDASPAAGRRVKMVADQYAGTQVHHSLYLPTNWQPEKKYPVIVEYAGNGPSRNQTGDYCSGKVEDCNLGYGICGGKDFIWVCLPYISVDGRQNQTDWWGDVEATVKYCKAVVPRICEKFGGDPSAIFLAGFSKGSIACNFIGLHDDEIAQLWRGFICHSHYDGVQPWQYAGSDRQSALKRLRRLGRRPQFISHEVRIDDAKNYLFSAMVELNSGQSIGNEITLDQFTLLAVPYRNHTDSWVLRDIPERKTLRNWVRDNLPEQDHLK